MFFRLMLLLVLLMSCILNVKTAHADGEASEGLYGTLLRTKYTKIANGRLQVVRFAGLPGMSDLDRSGICSVTETTEAANNSISTRTTLYLFAVVNEMVFISSGTESSAYIMDQHGRLHLTVPAMLLTPSTSEYSGQGGVDWAG